MSERVEPTKRRKRGEANLLVDRMRRGGQTRAYAYECLACRAWHVDVNDGSSKHRNRHFCN